MLGHPSLSPRGCEAPAVLSGPWFLSSSSHTELVLIFHIEALATDSVAVCDESVLYVCVDKGHI